MTPTPAPTPDPAAAAALLAAVAGMNPPQRSRFVATYARDLPPERRVPVLAALSHGDWYARRIGLLMAVVVGDTAYQGWAVTEPMLRGPALRSPAVPDHAIGWLAVEGSLSGRGAATRWLRRNRRADLADRLLPQVRARWGDAAAAQLLASCSGPVVAAALPELAYAVKGWPGLATRYPDVVTAYVDRAVPGLPPHQRSAWLKGRADLLNALAEIRPDVVLGWFERWLEGSLAIGLGRLLAVDPRRVVRLVLSDPERIRTFAYTRLGRRERERLATVPDDELGRLLAATDRARGAMVAVLRAVAPSRRGAIFDAAYAGADRTVAMLEQPVLELLPHARRHAEARRMGAMPTVTNQATKWWIASFLPYAEAVEQLAEPIRSRSADERGLAYEYLIRAAALDPDPAAVRDLLGRLGRLRNEQDPVRGRALNALATVPPDRFAADSVPALTELTRDALDARDTSHGTKAALDRLAARLLWHTAARTPSDTAPGPARAERAPSNTDNALFDWALDTVERVADWGRATTGVRLDRMLRRGQEHVVFERLRPTLETRLARGYGSPVLSLVTALGRRAWAMPDLQALLSRVARLSSDWTVQEAVRLWLAPHGGRSAKLDELTAADPSTICLEPVLAIAARSRVDLIDRLLLANTEPPTGRFEPEADYVPSIPRRNLLAWAPDQIGRFVARVDAAIADTGLSRDDRAGQARVRVAVPGTPVAAVTHLLDHSDVLIAEGALTGLADDDDPLAALPELLARTDGDRARVTLYAAGRCVREVPPGRVGTMLADLLAYTPKVSARKEAARLLTLLRPPGAVDALLAAAGRTEEHRDVRAAVFIALRGWLDDERVWPALWAGTDDDRHVAGALLGVHPAGLAAPHRPRYAALVTRLAAHRDPTTAAAAFLALPAWARWPAGMRDAVLAAVTAPHREVWRAALGAAADPRFWRALPALPGDVVATLMARTAAEPDAEAKQDRPIRHRLTELAAALNRVAVTARREPDAVRRCADLLKADPTLVPMAASLYTALLTPATVAAGLPALADLLAGYPVAAAWLARVLAGRSDWDADTATAGASPLAGRADVAAGLLLTGLVGLGGQRSGWAAPWRDRLRELRRHPAVEVRVAALEVRTVTW